MRRLLNASLLTLLVAALLLVLPGGSPSAATALASIGARELAQDEDGDDFEEEEDVDEMDAEDEMDEEVDDDVDDEVDDEMDDFEDGEEESDEDMTDEDEMDHEEMEEEGEMEESAEYEEEYSEEYSAETSEEFYEEFEQFDAEAEEYGEAWSVDVQLTEVGHEHYNYAVVLPVGGTYRTEAEMGIDSAADAMAYPFIWTNEGGPLVFDMIMLGVIDHGAKISAKAFARLEAAEHKSMLAEFPRRVVKPEPHKLGRHKWLFSAYRTKDGQAEVTKFSTHAGSRYYSFFFFGPAKVANVELAWAQMAAIVSSFKLK